MTVFEPQIYGILSGRSTNWATTTAHLQNNLVFSVGAARNDGRGPRVLAAKVQSPSLQSLPTEPPMIHLSWYREGDGTCCGTLVGPN